MKQKKKRQAGMYICLLLLWMGVIYSFSAQKSEQSSHMSQGISYRLVHEIDQTFSFGWSDEKEKVIAEGIEFPIRKAAHMTEYAILGLLFMGAFSAWQTADRWKYMLAQLGTMLYAATDEFHQTFISGRDGNIRDVWIDGAGCLIALLCYYGVYRIRKKKQEKSGE